MPRVRLKQERALFAYFRGRGVHAAGTKAGRFPEQTGPLRTKGKGRLYYKMSGPKKAIRPAFFPFRAVEKRRRRRKDAVSDAVLFHFPAAWRLDTLPAILYNQQEGTGSGREKRSGTKEKRRSFFAPVLRRGRRFCAGAIRSGETGSKETETPRRGESE